MTRASLTVRVVLALALSCLARGAVHTAFNLLEYLLLGPPSVMLVTC
jgi:hypothetical protein